jgi:hypothetical protein
LNRVGGLSETIPTPIIAIAVSKLAIEKRKPLIPKFYPSPHVADCILVFIFQGANFGHHQHEMPISQAVAALQIDFRVRQAADYFAESTRKQKTPQTCELNRKRFITNARLAMPSLGLDGFQQAFEQHLRALSNSGWSA